MNTTLVVIPAELIVDWDSFHDVFADVLGFPSFYGRNMDAWIDCMTSADEPREKMLVRAVDPGGLLTLQIDEAAAFAARCPEQFNALVECTAFVNYRRIEVGGKPVLSLLLSGNFP
ncbi:barstar family protein [Brevundimonas sp.]|uniref:barstar family protein n=1 Tax=Brevundimonas sp. TaxID=1871086 RepID=UPI00272EF346|nr:barstar family protein [Brevundimonas sp.]MDP1914410.1 barstar family protein [Brevundimonas sp.]